MHIAYEEDAMHKDVIDAWHEAVNNRDLAAAQKLVTDPVDVSGPRGTQSITAAAFADWIVRSGISLRPMTSHRVNDDTVVVEQEATWPENPNGTATVATLFRLREGVISAMYRFESLEEALRAAGPSGSSR
jgi:SnoaL-like protein